jgi:hypothetical protein
MNHLDITNFKLWSETDDDHEFEASIYQQNVTDLTKPILEIFEYQNIESITLYASLWNNQIVKKLRVCMTDPIDKCIEAPKIWLTIFKSKVYQSYCVMPKTIHHGDPAYPMIKTPIADYKTNVSCKKLLNHIILPLETDDYGFI